MKVLRGLQVGVRALAPRGPLVTPATTTTPTTTTPASAMPIASEPVTPASVIPTPARPPVTREPPSPSSKPTTCAAWPFDQPTQPDSPPPAKTTASAPPLPANPTRSPPPANPSSPIPASPATLALRSPSPPPGLRRSAPSERPPVDPPLSAGLSVEPKPRARVEAPASFTTSLTNSSLNLATIRAEPAPATWNDRGTLDTTEIFRRAEALLGAFGQAMTIAQDRRASETLDVLLTAQHENLALVLQGMAQQRQEYGEALERTIERFARDLAPESILTIGETFRMSAGEITGALRRGEHLQGRVLTELTGIRELLAKLVQNGAALAASPSPAKIDELRIDKPALALVLPAKKAAPESPLLHLDDDE